MINLEQHYNVLMTQYTEVYPEIFNWFSKQDVAFCFSTSSDNKTIEAYFNTGSGYYIAYINDEGIEICAEYPGISGGFISGFFNPSQSSETIEFLENLILVKPSVKTILVKVETYDNVPATHQSDFIHLDDVIDCLGRSDFDLEIQM